jgi:hypothetical protein
MHQCSGIKQDRTQCQREIGSGKYCYQHQILATKKQSNKTSTKKKTFASIQEQKKTSSKKPLQKPKTMPKQSKKDPDNADIWRIIESLNWTKDHDVTRVTAQFLLLSRREAQLTNEFVFERVEELLKKYKRLQVLGKWKKQDSLFSNLMADVVARGEAFYNEINATKLKKMMKEEDLETNFEDVFD